MSTILNDFNVCLSAPSRAPVSATTHKSTSMSLVVKWSHLLEEDFQGHPIGYRIAYTPADEGRDINFVRVNYTTNTATLTDLSVYTMYVINVSAVSSGGIGPAKTVKARTDAGGIIKIYNLSMNRAVKRKDLTCYEKN